MMDAEGLPRQVVVVWQVSSLRVTSPGTGLWYVPVQGHVLEQDLLDAGIDTEQFSVRVEHGNILRRKRLQRL